MGLFYKSLFSFVFCFVFVGFTDSLSGFWNRKKNSESANKMEAVTGGHIYGRVQPPDTFNFALGHLAKQQFQQKKQGGVDGEPKPVIFFTDGVRRSPLFAVFPDFGAGSVQYDGTVYRVPIQTAPEIASSSQKMHYYLSVSRLSGNGQNGGGGLSQVVPNADAEWFLGLRTSLVNKELQVELGLVDTKTGELVPGVKTLAVGRVLGAKLAGAAQNVDIVLFDRATIEKQF